MRAGARDIITPVTYKGGEHYAYVLECPGCEKIHVYDKRWTLTGDRTSPTFTPSYLATKQWNKFVCHSYVTDGKIRFLDDCTHSLSGQTVQLDPITGDW